MCIKLRNELLTFFEEPGPSQPHSLNLPQSGMVPQH